MSDNCTTKRYLFEVVILTRDCELGKEGERGVVIDLVDQYMTLIFPDRDFNSRKEHTGSDYRFLRTTVVARGVK